ncbi:MAG TPA: prolipoprotein diacylglyceryl transferase [Clostridiales bacterium]|nr:prolipoprotein diacylglyceryl transferase [Clostridiales bacterium]
MNSVAFTIGSWPIHWYGILISAAFIIGVFLVQFLATKRGYDIDHLWTIFLLLIPCAVVGARLYYVIFSWDTGMYADDPLLIFQTWRGGLAIHGGLLAGILVIFIGCRKYQMDFFGVLDCFAPAVVLGQAIGRWGNYLNGEAYGSVTTLPWGIHVAADQELHHPTFLYESLWDLLVFILLMALFKKSKRNGNVVLVYLIAYSVGRFFIEGLRMDSLMIGPLRQAQVLSVVLIVIAGAILLYRNRKASPLDHGKKASTAKKPGKSVKTKNTQEAKHIKNTKKKK